MEEEQKVKTYKPKNIKFLLSLLLINILSVSILWYLISSGHFLPINDLGGYEWINILTFILLYTSVIGSFVTMSSYLIMVYLFKKEENFKTGLNSFKWGLLLFL